MTDVRKLNNLFRLNALREEARKGGFLDRIFIPEVKGDLSGRYYYMLVFNPAWNKALCKGKSLKPEDLMHESLEKVINQSDVIGNLYEKVINYKG